jgi:hypothetical protein
MVEENKRPQAEGKVEPKTGDPAAAGKEDTKVTSEVPEKAEGQLNPSSPGDTGTTPGSNAPLG